MLEVLEVLEVLLQPRSPSFPSPLWLRGRAGSQALAQASAAGRDNQGVNDPFQQQALNRLITGL